MHLQLPIMQQKKINEEFNESQFLDLIQQKAKYNF